MEGWPELLEAPVCALQWLCVHVMTNTVLAQEAVALQAERSTKGLDRPSPCKCLDPGRPCYEYVLTGAQLLLRADVDRYGRYGFDGLFLQGPPRERLQPPRPRGQRRAPFGPDRARIQIESRRPDISMIRARAVQAEAVEVEAYAGELCMKINDVALSVRCPAEGACMPARVLEPVCTAPRARFVLRFVCVRSR